jgi:hypothetical protein
MAELKCPCHLREDMDWDDCDEMDCNECCPLTNGECGTPMVELKPCKCGQCGEVKEPVAFVDGKPWCEDCFDNALGVNDNG